MNGVIFDGKPSSDLIVRRYLIEGFNHGSRFRERLFIYIFISSDINRIKKSCDEYIQSRWEIYSLSILMLSTLFKVKS